MATLRAPAHRVSPRARWMWIVSEVVVLIVLAVAAAVGVYFWDWFADRWWIAAVVVGLQAVNAVVAPFVRYHVHRWEVTDTAAYTQTGLWSIERQIAPLSRIQTVQFAQGPVARIFGLASVSITTASAGGDIEINGLDRRVAEALADELTVKADLEDGDAT